MEPIELATIKTAKTYKKCQKVEWKIAEIHLLEQLHKYNN